MRLPFWLVGRSLLRLAGVHALHIARFARLALVGLKFGTLFAIESFNGFPLKVFIGGFAA